MIKTGDVLSDSKNYVLSDPGLITSIIRVALDQLKLSITSNIMEHHKAKAAKEAGQADAAIAKAEVKSDGGGGSSGEEGSIGQIGSSAS